MLNIPTIGSTRLCELLVQSMLMLGEPLSFSLVDGG